MQVVVTPEAPALLESRKRWWRANRPATAELFEREFLDAVAVIGDRPVLFPVAVRIGGREIHRVLLEKTSCHLYYEIDEVAAVVKVVSTWGAAQGKRPQL